jgi:choline dehydrogenase-like flavoprotein
MNNALTADVVVIGAGICGAMAARKLAEAGASVLMLEAGPQLSTAELVHNYRSGTNKSDFVAPYPFSPQAPQPLYSPSNNGYLEQVGPHHFDAQYLKLVGGTSWHWAAQTWRFLPNDFRIHSLYGVGRDWPVSYDELEPWYYEAESIMGVGGEETLSPRKQPWPMERVAEPWLQQRFRDRLAPDFKLVSDSTARNSRAFDGRPACCGNNNCMPLCPIDAQYHGGISADAAVKAGVKLMTKSVVYKLEHDEKGRIVAAHFYDWDKGSHRVVAKTFVLAANAIEIPKLLFMSASDKFRDGLANSSGTMGRNLMDHPAVGVTFEVDEDLWPGRGPVSPCSIGDFRDGDFRGEHGAFRLDLSNASAVAGVTAALIKKGVYGAALDQAIRKRAARQVSMKNCLEQLPDANNRVTLSDHKDALGLPTPRLFWNIDDYVVRGTVKTREMYNRIAEKMGGTNIVHSKEGAFSNRQHITGTLAMGADPSTSVTDAFGRAHDHENLYMVSTGVMPTVATCNATLTAIALSLRTADAIHKAA